MLFSVHRVEQSLVCASLCLLGVRPKTQSKIKVLRVRRETGVQKMLREIPQRIATSPENITREYDEKTNISRRRRIPSIQIAFCFIHTTKQ